MSKGCNYLQMKQLTILQPMPSPIRWARGPLSIRVEGSLWMVVCSGIVLYRIEILDSFSMRYAIISLVDDGLLSLPELPAAFGYNARSYYRWKEQLASEGIAGLLDHPRRNYPWKLRALEDALQTLYQQDSGSRRAMDCIGARPRMARLPFDP